MQGKSSHTIFDLGKLQNSIETLEVPLVVRLNVCEIHRLSAYLAFSSSARSVIIALVDVLAEAKKTAFRTARVIVGYTSLYGQIYKKTTCILLLCTLFSFPLLCLITLSLQSYHFSLLQMISVSKSALLGLSFLVASALAAPTDATIKRDSSACTTIQTGPLRIVDNSGSSYDMVAQSDTFVARPASSAIYDFAFDSCELDFLGYTNGAERVYNKKGDTVKEYWGKLKYINNGQEDDYCLASSYGNFFQYKPCTEDDSDSTRNQIFRLQVGPKGSQISFYPIKNNTNNFVYKGQNIFYYHAFTKNSSPQVLGYSYVKTKWSLEMI